MTSHGEHRRVNLGVLAAAEKCVLVWTAKRLPPRIHSDHLTALGVVGMLLAGLSFAACRYDSRFSFLAVLGLGINWFGDSLDGTVARVRNQLRPRYGYYVDHVVDVFGVLVLLGGLGFSGLMSPLIAGWLAVAFLAAFAEISIATHALGEFRLSFWKLGPTELRLLLCAGALYVWHQPWVSLFGEPHRLFDVGGIAGAAGLLAAAFASFARNARILYAAEPLR